MLTTANFRKKSSEKSPVVADIPDMEELTLQHPSTPTPEEHIDIRSLPALPRTMHGKAKARVERKDVEIAEGKWAAHVFQQPDEAEPDHTPSPSASSSPKRIPPSVMSNINLLPLSPIREEPAVQTRSTSSLHLGSHKLNLKKSLMFPSDSDSDNETVSDDGNDRFGNLEDISGDDKDPVFRDDATWTRFRTTRPSAPYPTESRRQSFAPTLQHTSSQSAYSQWEQKSWQTEFEQSEYRLDSELRGGRPSPQVMLQTRSVFEASNSSRQYGQYLPTQSPHLDLNTITEHMKLLNATTMELHAATLSTQRELVRGKQLEEDPSLQFGDAETTTISSPATTEFPTSTTEEAKKKKKKKKSTKKKKKSTQASPMLHSISTPTDSELLSTASAAEAELTHPLLHPSICMDSDTSSSPEPEPETDVGQAEMANWAARTRGVKVTPSVLEMSEAARRVRSPAPVDVARVVEETRWKEAPHLTQLKSVVDKAVSAGDREHDGKQRRILMREPAPSKPVGPPVVEGKGEVEQDMQFSDLQMLQFSSRVPSALYGALLDEILRMGWDIKGMARRPDVMIKPMDRYHRPDYRRIHPTEQQAEIDRATRASLTINLQRKPDATPPHPVKCMEELHAFMMRTIRASTTQFMQWEIEEMEEVNVDDLVWMQDGQVLRNIGFDGSDKRLPPRQRAEERLTRLEPFYTNAELPQIVFVAARLKFAIPILRKLTEPVVDPRKPSVFSRCELLGFKYLSELLPYTADYLNPYLEETEPAKYARAMELLVNPEDAAGGWVIMVFRLTDGFRRVGEVVDAYLASYQTIASTTTTTTFPSLIRRPTRRRTDSKFADTPSPAEPNTTTPSQNGQHPDVLTPTELLHLNAMVFKDVQACYQLVTLFFRDAELIPGDPSLWEDREFHPQEYLCNPFVSKSMISAPPFLSTVCVVKAPLFPQLGGILSRLAKEGFSLSSLKMARIGPTTGRRLLWDNCHRDYAVVVGKEVADAFVSAISEGPSLVFVLQRENGVKRWGEVIADIRSKLSNTSKTNDMMWGGVYASPSYQLALSQKVNLLPEGVAVGVKAFARGNKLYNHIPLTYETNSPPSYQIPQFIKTLYPHHITEIPKIPRKCFPSFPSTRRDSTSSSNTSSSTGGAGSRNSSPPPTAHQHPASEVVTAILLPAKECFEDNVEVWQVFLEACLVGTRDGGGGEVDSAVDVREQQREKEISITAKSERKGRGRRRNFGPGSAASGTRSLTPDWDGSDGTHSDAGSAVGGGGGGVGSWTQAMKLVGCKYLVCGEDVVRGWMDTRERWRDGERGARDDFAAEGVCFCFLIGVFWSRFAGVGVWVFCRFGS
ncbi:hypothetical protein HDV00_010975 [Rhizophlyctis rosea]|nr:hypothetical protein HDV00_010975 [Rhizophlyctis rosea]